MPTGADDLDRKLLDAIERLGRALRVARQRIATTLGVTTLQIEIIDRLDHLGPLPVGRLARELDITQPTASDAIATLERKGFLERSRSTDDGRITVAQLTVTGRATAATIRDELHALQPDPHQAHRPERAIALEVLLREILRLQRAGVITINRSCFTCRHYQPPTGGTPAHCLLLDTPLEPAQLRVDCPDHDPADGPDPPRSGSRSGPAVRRRGSAA